MPSPYCHGFSFIGRSHFPGVSDPSASAGWFSARQALLLDEAEGGALGVFRGGWAQGPNHTADPARCSRQPHGVVPGTKKQALRQCPSFVTACCEEARGGQSLWVHKSITPQQYIHQRWQLREGFLCQHQSFAQLPSFTACIKSGGPSLGNNSNELDPRIAAERATTILPCKTTS